MNIIAHTLDFRVTDPCVLSLGKFDGLHEGHRYLLEGMNHDLEQGLSKVLFTFDVSPRIVMDDMFKVLLTTEEREDVFRNACLDYVIECPFDGEIRNMSPYDFLVFLTERVNVKKIVVGDDFRFGHNRSGSYEDLIRYESEFGYRTVVVEKKQYEGKDISSTRIREALNSGNMPLVNTLLGYAYFAKGTVVYGNQIGNKIGIPTANILPAKCKELPPYGVYRSEILLDGVSYHGISNIGKKPTIEGDYPVGIETYIFDFHEDIYGKEMTVSFLEYVRPEMRFDSLDQLVARMNQDIELVRAAFACSE